MNKGGGSLLQLDKVARYREYRERGDNGLFFYTSPQSFIIKVFLFVGLTTLGTFTEF